MELEKIAISAVETSIGKTDLLTSFINRGDKEPCWDGNIYIHESRDHTKRNIKKVSTQIKGKLVTSCKVEKTVKYRISQDDLRACLISSDEDGNEGESKNLSRNNEFTLTIFPKPAEFIQPAEKALYHPTTRQHNKSV